MFPLSATLRKTTLSVSALLLFFAAADLARAENTRPDAHVLAVGVAKYRTKRYNVPLPDKNAQDVLALFEAQEGKLFGRVESGSLLNEEATRDAILEALDDLADATRAGDYAVIYLCGHGTSNGRDWYFVPHDATKAFDSLISGKELETKLAALVQKGSRVLLLIDSCHSGALKLDMRKLTGSRGAGVAVFAGCLGSEVCYVGPGKNSCFTLALLEALGGAADYNHDGIVTLVEIQLYVSERVETMVAELPKEPDGPQEQRPTTTHSLTIPNSFPLAKVTETVATTRGGQ